MLYRFLKIAARLAFPLFCRKVVINKPAALLSSGPLLLACNHPNSFLDSVIIDTLFKRPVWSLARGDAFRKPFHAKLLRKLNILPVYRTTEGVENLSENYKTFEECLNIFRRQGIITIFSEGKCINEWHLRPLKKGTARLAIKAWEEGIPLKVLPVGINYSSFTRFGKNIRLSFGEPLSVSDIRLSEPDGVRNLAFNMKLEEQLKKLVIKIPKNNTGKLRDSFYMPVPVWKQIALAIPAAIGYLAHFPLYWPIKKIVLAKTRNNDHYDSIMTAVLLLSYPLYLLLIAILTHFVIDNRWLIVIPFLMPVTAWCYIQVKKQMDK